MDLGGPDPLELGPTFYEVEFSEDDGDLTISETAGTLATEPFFDPPRLPFPLKPVEDDQSATIEDWDGSVTLDVHCSLHSILLDVNEGELISRRIKSEGTEPPYALHAGFLKMEGGLTITR